MTGCFLQLLVFDLKLLVHEMLHFLILLLILLPSSEIQNRQEMLDKKETELNQREQQLLLKEDSLQLKASELSQIR